MIRVAHVGSVLCTSDGGWPDAPWEHRVLNDPTLVFHSGPDPSGGNEKWAEWSPWRCPISLRPSLKANSPRRPGPASIPGQEGLRR